MLRLIKIFALGIIVVPAIFSCVNKNTREQISESLHISSEEAEIIIDSSSWYTDKKLSVPAYQSWLKKQRGVTCDLISNNDFDIMLWYQPLPLEASLALINSGDTSRSQIDKYINLKKGYHYISLECLYKNPSVNNPLNKEQFFNTIRENFYFVLNNDTVKNPIIEIFPATLMNQPHHVLILIPAEEGFSGLTAGLKCKSMGFKRDLRLSLSTNQYNTLPEIKL